MDGGTRRTRWLAAAALAWGAASAPAQTAAPVDPAVPPSAPEPAVVVVPEPAPVATPAAAPTAEPPAAAPTAAPAAGPPAAPPTAAPAAGPPAAPPATPPAPAPARPVRVVAETGARYGDLSIPLTLSPALLRVLLSGATVERPLPTGGRLTWRQEARGAVVAQSITRQGLPWNETGAWRIDEEGRYCFSLAWLERAEENWCHLVVKSDEGYFLVGGTKADDPVQRIYIDGR